MRFPTVTLPLVSVVGVVYGQMRVVCEDGTNADENGVAVGANAVYAGEVVRTAVFLSVRAVASRAFRLHWWPR